MSRGFIHILSPAPSVCGVTDGLGRSILEPGHERAVKLEMASAFSLEEAPDVLRIPIGRCDGRCPRELILVPVKICQGRSPCLPL
jgi:hypothetical protein